MAGQTAESAARQPTRRRDGAPKGATPSMRRCALRIGCAEWRAVPLLFEGEKKGRRLTPGRKEYGRRSVG